MTEYQHDDPDDGGADYAPPALDPPDALDDHVPAHEHPPLDDLGSAGAPLPEELHFPGDEPQADAPDADADPAAPWPDDARFEEWLEGHDASTEPDAPPADRDLRDALSAPADDAALPPSDALVDATLRRLAGE